MKKFALLLLVVLTSLPLQAKIWLPNVLSDNMLLQRESTSTIWGWTAAPSEKITVIGSWNNVAIQTQADQGLWSVELPTPKAGGPFQITIVGHETLVLRNVMIGELWLCSGQSNMQWTPLMGLDNAEAEIAQADYPKIRLFTVPIRKSAHPQDDTPGEWVECSPESMQHFSSVAYFFGRKLHQELNIPIGLINTSWGGTPIEPWIPKELIEGDTELNAEAKKLSRFVWWPEEAGVTYNAMIHPLTKLDIAGALWYQGESNRPNAFSYYKTLPLMINAWRKAWDKEFAFYHVQIAPYNYNTKTNIDAAVVRDAQLYTMRTVPFTGMVVTNDIGNLKDIHPTNKQDVGKRLALWALAHNYGKKDIIYSGPVYEKMEIQKNKAIIHFEHADKGLMMKGEALKEFYIAGSDQQFHLAEAKIKGNTVEVSSPKVKVPAAVRFAFSNRAEPNLFNAAGLPASAFRTDDWEISFDQ